MTTSDMSRPSNQSPPLALPQPSNPDRAAQIDRLGLQMDKLDVQMSEIQKTIHNFGSPMLHPAAPAALKATIVAALRMDGKYKEANELEGTKEETGLSGYYQKGKQFANVPLTLTSSLKVAGGAVAGAAVLDFALDLADASLPRTGVLGWFKGIFGGSNKKR